MPAPRQGAFQAPGAAAPVFQYTGATAMTVVGGATGRTYRFDAPGARAAIDLRDQESLARVPNLRRVMIAT
jgi:hypothetical protein